jgi:hypothetical protein
MSRMGYYEKYHNAVPAIASNTTTIPIIFMVASNAASSVCVMGSSLCVAIETSIARNGRHFEGRRIYN